jgi:hypothetical protein
MQSAQEFIESFLREKAEALRSSRNTHRQLREKFFSKEIVQFYSKWEEERDKNPESVSIIEITDNTASFITSELIREKLWRNRHHLRFSENKWEIHKMEAECFVCKGTGNHADKPCRVCGGIGWKDYAREKPDK